MGEFLVIGGAVCRCGSLGRRFHERGTPPRMKRERAGMLAFRFARGIRMSIEDNKQLIQRLFEDVINGGRTEVLDEIFVPGWSSHYGPV